MGTILVIDDDEGVAHTFAHALRHAGYDVRTALNGESGLREVQKFRPDAILLDLRMPLMDGLAFLRRLRVRKHTREIPVAVVTGDYFLPDTEVREIARLGAELRFKPMWLEDLVGLVAHLLQRVPTLQ